MLSNSFNLIPQNSFSTLTKLILIENSVQFNLEKIFDYDFLSFKDL